MHLSFPKRSCVYWNSIPHASSAARFAQCNLTLQMTNVLLTCSMTKVLCVLLGCARQVQNVVTQAWNWKGGKWIKSICQMITACTCLLEKTSPCFQKPPAADPLCLKSMLSISETDLYWALNFSHWSWKPFFKLHFCGKSSCMQTLACKFTSSIGENQVRLWMFNPLKCTCGPMALSRTVQGRTLTFQLEWLLKAMGNVMDKGLGTSKEAA